MRVKITQVGFESYSGQLGTVVFSNGVSVLDLTPEQAMMIGAVVSVDWYEDAVPYAWVASAAVALNTMSTDASGTNVYKATTAGTSGAAAPAWPASPAAGTTVTDNTVTWTWQYAMDQGQDAVADGLVFQ